MFGLSSTPLTSAADTGGSNTISVAVTENEEEPDAPPPPLGDRRKLIASEEQGDCRTKNCAGSATAPKKRIKAASERDLPTGVFKTTSGKFGSQISWGGKTHYIGSFDTPEQASAAYVSVEKDRDDANLSAQSADEVNAAFDAAQKKALEAVGGSSKETSERDLPRGVQKTSSGKFKSMIGWGGKNRNIGSFDTPEQASAAFMSVRTDRDDANLSAQSADEVDVLFYAAKKRALEAVGGNIRKKELPKGVQKISSGKFQSQIYCNGTQRQIGLFDTPEEASAAYLSVKTDLAYANLSAQSADEVNAAFDAAQKKALESFGGVVAKKRDLPKGVYKATSGRFEARITLSGNKTRQIGTFDTPEQAPAAYVSVKKDLTHAKLSAVGTDEVNAAFDAAKKKAVVSVGGTLNKKRGPPKGYKLPCPDDGERETKRKRKVAEPGLATGAGVSEKLGGRTRAAVGHGEKIGKSGTDHQATSERDLGGIFDPEVDGVFV